MRAEEKQTSPSCQGRVCLCARLCVSACVCATDTALYRSPLGCGSRKSPAEAVTRYSTHTFLLRSQACLCATNSRFGLTYCKTVLRAVQIKRACKSTKSFIFFFLKGSACTLQFFGFKVDLCEITRDLN